MLLQLNQAQIKTDLFFEVIKIFKRSKIRKQSNEYDLLPETKDDETTFWLLMWLLFELDSSILHSHIDLFMDSDDLLLFDESAFFETELWEPNL